MFTMSTGMKYHQGYFQIKKTNRKNKIVNTVGAVLSIVAFVLTWIIYIESVL